MSDELLNPIQVAQELNYFLPLESVIIERKIEGEFIIDKVRYKGKPISGERISIYATHMHKEESEKAPAILLLNECGKPIDLNFMRFFAEMGYSVLMPDYCGETAENKGNGHYTIYPQKIEYANYERCPDRLYPNDNSVLDTCWFEWLGVAKVSLDYLKSVTRGKIGLVGLRGGGELVWKLMLDESVACGITMNATGWLTYRNYPRFSKERKALNQNDLKFMAGLDSQSYAPFIKAPILLLGTTGDERFDIDRAYDTFLRIPKTIDKTLSYSVRHDGLLGKRAQADIRLFLSKYLSGREVFIPDPAEVTVTQNGKGQLEAKVSFDETSSVERHGLYIAENAQNHCDRVWRRVNVTRVNEQGEEVFLLPVCETTKEIYLYAFYVCTNGFTASSRIIRHEVGQNVSGCYQRNHVLYSGKENAEFFYAKMPQENMIADYILKGPGVKKPEVKAGFGNILGLECKEEIKTYLVAAEKYKAEGNSMFSFNLQADEKTQAKISFRKRIDGKVFEYCYTAQIEKCGRWQKYLLKANEFFCEERKEALPSFAGVNCLLFETQGEPFLVNNIIWI